MDAEALVGRVEELTAQLDTIGDPFAQSCAEELVGALMQLYGEGLERSVISQAGDFLFIPPGVPHQPVNLSATERAVALIARNDAGEQERVVPYQAS